MEVELNHWCYTIDESDNKWKEWKIIGEVAIINNNLPWIIPDVSLCSEYFINYIFGTA